MLQLCNGLGFAHSKGLVHRDIKPPNVLITLDGTAKVTDFGLVRRVRERAKEATDATLTVAAGPGSDWAGASVHTMKGFGFGTPHYMAPEQWKDASVATVESDVYSFGVTMYEVLCGRRPFEPVATGTAGLEQLEALHNTQSPELPADLSPALQQVVRRCLEKETARRYQSFDEVHDDLGDVFRRLTRRDPPRVRASGLGGRPDELNNRALSQLDLGQPEAARRLLLDALRADPAHLKVNLNLLLLDWREGRIADDEVIARAQELEQQYADKGSVLFFLGMAHLLRGDLTRAEDWLRRALAAKPGHESYLSVLGLCLLRQGRSREALAEFREALVKGGEVGTLINAAIAAFREGQHEDARRYLERAASAGASSHEFSVVGGVLQTGQGELESALSAFSAVLREDPDHPLANLSMGELLAGVTTTVSTFEQAGTAKRATTYLERSWKASGGTPRAYLSLALLAKDDLEARLDRLSVERDLSRATRKKRASELVSFAVEFPAGGRSRFAPGERAPDRTIAAARWMTDDLLVVAERNGVVSAGGRTLVDVKEEIVDAAVDVTRSLVATAGERIRLWRWPDGAESGSIAAGARAIAFLPSLGLIAGSVKSSIRLWDTKGAIVRTIDTDASETRFFSFAPAAGLLACGHTTTVSVYDARTGELAHRVPPHSAPVTSVQLSRDGRLLMTAGLDGRVCLWRMGAGRDPEMMLAVASASAAALSPDVQFIATLEAGRKLRLWDAGRGRCLRTELLREPADGVAFSPSGRRLALWGWEVGTAELRTRSDQAAPDQFQLGFFLSRPRSAVVIAREHGEVEHLLEYGRSSLDRGEWRRAYQLFRAAQETRGFQRDREVLAGVDACAAHGTREQVREAWLRRSVTGEFRSVMLSVGGRFVYALAGSGIQRWWIDQAGDAETWPLPKPPEYLRLSPDGRRLAAVYRKRILVVDAATGQVGAALGDADHVPLICADFTPDAGLLLAGGTDGKVRAFTSSGDLHGLLEGHAGAVSALSISADGVFLATASVDRTIRLWKVSDGAPLGATTVLRDLPRMLAVTNDGRVLALDEAHTLLSWSAEGGALKEGPSIDLVSGRIMAFDFTGDRRCLVTAGPHDSVTLWAVEGGQARRLRSFEAHTEPPLMVRFSADARRILSTQRSGFFVWQVDWEYGFADRKP